MGTLTTSQKAGYDALVAADPMTAISTETSARTTADGLNLGKPRWRPNDRTARLALTVSSSDIGATAFEISNSSLWTLVDNTLVASDEGWSPADENALLVAGGVAAPLDAHCCVVKALPAYTVVLGGTPGIGDTLEFNANGVADPTIFDGRTLAVGDRVGIFYGVNSSNYTACGLWDVTVAGAVGAKLKFIRNMRANTSAKLAGAVVFIRGGLREKGKLYTLSLDSAGITIGTTPLLFDHQADQRCVISTVDDFDAETAALTSSGTFYNNRWICFFSGTGSQVISRDGSLTNDATRVGVLNVTAGTATTGQTNTQARGFAIQWNQNKRIRCGFRFEVSGISDGTHTGTPVVGFENASFVQGFKVRGNATTNDLELIGGSSSGITTTSLATAYVANTQYDIEFIKKLGATTLDVLLNGVVKLTGIAIPTTTNLYPKIESIKTAGATAWTVSPDKYWQEVYDPLA